jgi:hypothetical protein
MHAVNNTCLNRYHDGDLNMTDCSIRETLHVNNLEIQDGMREYQFTEQISCIINLFHLFLSHSDRSFHGCNADCPDP